MGQREFLDTIQVYCRRLNLAGFLKKLVFAVSIGAGAGIVFQAAAFVTPLYYVNVYTGIALLFAVVTAIVVSWIQRNTMEHTALVMDRFGFQERIITAYEHLKDEGELLVLQRKDAMEQLKMHRDRIRIPLLPDWKRIALSAALLAVMIALALLPSQMKNRAGELHQVQQEAREKEEEIKEVLDELAELEQEALTPEQLAALQEMMESLQSSMSEYQQAASAEALQAAGEKLNYKYANIGSQMSALVQSLQNGATVSQMSAQAMQAMADKMQELSGNPSMGGDSLASNQGRNGGSQNSQNSKNSQNGSGQSGQGNGQNGSSQSGQGDGQNGQGDGQDGQGNGQNGQGDGSGAGRGTGSANISHDYVSIPNAIADSGNLTGNAANHDNSEYFRAQNGLSWEGTHMSHEAVIGSYEQNAYEGIAAGRYPSGMEGVIKEYFASFNN